MHPAPIIAAAPPAATGTDANAPADGGDLFAGLMAALFNPAQAMPIAPPPGQAPPVDGVAVTPAKGGGQAQAQAGAKTHAPLILPALAGKRGLVSNFAVDRMLIGDADQASADMPLILPPTGDAKGEPVDARPVIATVPQPKRVDLAQAGGRPAPAAAVAKDQDSTPLPSSIADQAAKPEVVAIRGQATHQDTAVPSPATLVAAQTQVAAPHAAPVQAAPVQAAAVQAAASPAAKPVAPIADAGSDRAAVGKPAKAAPAGSALQQVALSTRGEAAVEDAPAAGGDDHAHEGMDDDHTAQAAPGQANGGAALDKAAHSPIAIVRGSPHTVAHLSAEIARRLDAQKTRFQVELEPAGMGRVDVKIDIGASGALSASMNFDNPQSAEAMRARSGELQAALERRGFDVTGGLAFTTGGMDHGQSDHGAGRHAASAPPSALSASIDDPIIAAATPRTRAGDGRLDIRI